MSRRHELRTLLRGAIRPPGPAPAFEVRTRDGVGEDWPISYEDLKPHCERLELELPVSGEYWPWGDPHRYPHTPHPIAGGADTLRAGARRLGIEMKVGPV